MSVAGYGDNVSMSSRTDNVVRPIRVFVASPGGVEDERQAVRSIAEELNGSLLRNGWRIDILGWEDRGPTSGRPQADINTDVELCDVFVGVLWNRWGTPTGDHTSGFAEEWALARDRYRRTGSPGLWLYFKDPGASCDEDDPETRRVREFRDEVKNAEVAFYKDFDDVAQFTILFRRRLLDEIFRRSGLTRTDIGGVAIDWSATYDQDPVWLIPNGRERQTLAEELLADEPLKAADMLVRLADDVDEHGFADHANDLRISACRALLAADQPQDAIRLVRGVLASHVWWMRFENLDLVLRGLSEELPPEIAAELRGWRACARAAEDPAGVADELTTALDVEHAIPLDEDTVAHWRVVLWRCLLHEQQPGRVADDTLVIDPEAGEVQLELALLRADALRAAGSPDSDAAWQQLRLLAIEQATSAPSNAAWIATRVSLDLVARERLADAETAYTDAATRWSNAPAGHEQAALAFFSAQAAAHLNGEWDFRGWGWRGIAAVQRSSAMSFARRAEELESQALHRRLATDGPAATRLLLSALWLHQRAGLLHGVMKDLALLSDAYAADGDHVTAAELYCRTGNRKGAEAAATDATDRAAVVTRLDGKWQQWSHDARCGALARAGRSAPADVAARLVEPVTAALKPSDRMFDNTHRTAANALAELTLAIEDQAKARLAAGQLLELASTEDYMRAQAGRNGLRMLCDIGEDVYVDTLVACFVTDRRIDEPDPVWVAQHLSTPARIAQVRNAALTGHQHALLALIEADLITSDLELRDYCSAITKSMLASDLGKTPDGNGVWGLMALDETGAIAAATGDDILQQEAANKLLLYASQSRWPMINRVNAVAGLWPLLKACDDKRWLDSLQPLACPAADLDDEATRPRSEMWVQRGDLEAMALRVCASLASTVGSPGWLDNAIGDAGFDEREPVRQAAWYAAGIHSKWFDERSARHALVDSSPEVRVAALHAWGLQMESPLPGSSLRRLEVDKNIRVRLALVSELKQHPEKQATATLRSDADAYVRRIARRELRPGE
jgi:hypothetical protein